MSANPNTLSTEEAFNTGAAQARVIEDGTLAAAAIARTSAAQAYKYRTMQRDYDEYLAVDQFLA